MSSPVPELFNLAVGTLVAVPCVVGAAVGLRQPTPRWRGVGAGCVTVLLGLLVVAGVDLMIRGERNRVREGWDLIPVVVAADDLLAGTVITFDMVSQRPIPEQFVYDSIVRPDRANEIVGKKVIGHLHAGDPLTWPSVGQGVAPGTCDHGAR